jgi:SAM-dependent methyltransferase
MNDNRSMKQPVSSMAGEVNPIGDRTDAFYGLNEAAESPNYYAWLASCFAPHFRGRVLEHGAGTGLLSDAMLERGASSMVLTEPEPHLVDILRQRFRGRAEVEIFRGTVDAYYAEKGGRIVDTIVSSNVLEHVPDDVGCLGIMRELLVPGGSLGLYVPARPELYGEADRQVGHQRRYRRRELKQKLGAAGFEVLSLQYRNLIGALPWWISGRVLKQKKLNTTSIKIFDTAVFPIFRKLEDWVPPPYGMNLLAFAKKR